MNAPERSPSEATRARILEAAWDLFRQLGARATIADVAERLGMSSANIYRFFPSKQALCEAVCANQLGGMEQAAQAIAAGPGSPVDRLRAILLMLHSAMRDQMLNEKRVHEIVNVAIHERWAPIQAFEDGMGALIGGLIAEGQAKGVFGPGAPELLAAQTACACSCIHHPTLIALYAEPDATPSPEQAVDFVLRALGNLHPVSTSSQG